MIKKLLFIILFLCICFNAQAATWYLSPTGNDTTGDGSEGNPWFSPAKARRSNSSIAPGDTVIFKNGTYNYSADQCNLGYSGVDGGTAGNPITYRAEDTTHSVILNFGGSHYGWRFNTNGANNAAYITLDGFILLNYYYGVGIMATNITVKNSYSTSSTTWPASSDHWSSSYGNITTYEGGDNFIIENCILDELSQHGDSSGHGIYISGGGGIVRDNIIRNQHGGNGIQIQAGSTDHDINNVYVYRNKIYNNDWHGIYINAYDSGTIARVDAYNNLIWDCADDYSNAIYLSDEGTGVVTTGNIWNNTIYDSNGGIVHTNTTNGELRNNIVVSSGTPFSSGTGSNGNITKSNNLTTAGTEGASYGVIGSFDTADFQSTDAASADFLKIDASNNSIEAGYDLSATFTTDYWGTTRTVPFDIGAHEQSIIDETAPTAVSASILADGTHVRLVASENVQFGAGGTGGGALTGCSGGATTLGTLSVNGSYVEWTITSRTVYKGETSCVLAYTQPTDGLQDTSENDMATFDDLAVATTNAPALSTGTPTASMSNSNGNSSASNSNGSTSFSN